MVDRILKKVFLIFNVVLLVVLCPITVLANESEVESGYTIVETEKEDNSEEQPEISVDLVGGETTDSEVISSITTTGDVKESEEDTDYDYNVTTNIDREIQATTSEEKVVISESTSDLEGVNPVYDANKKDLYLGNFDDPDKKVVSEDGPENFDYQFVGRGDYSSQFVSRVYITYKKDENGNALVDENGNYIIESLKHANGTIITVDGVPTTDMNAVYDQKTGIRALQFMLKDKEGNVVYAYCIDLATQALTEYWYTVSNLEDNDYYASEEAEKHVRSIVMNGYWGTLSDADGDGSFDIGSLALIKQKLKVALANGEIDNEVTVSYRENGEIVTKVIIITDQVIDNLTEGEALDMTQAAIWTYANGAQAVQNGKDGIAVGGTMYGDMANGNRTGKNDPEGMARMTILYNWLINLDTEEKSTVVINDKNYVEDLSLTVGNRVNDDVYETAINFDLAYETVDKDDLTIYLSYENEDGQEQTIVKRIAGELKDGEEYIKTNENGYIIDGLNLRNNTEFKFSLRLSGFQNLELGAYVYTSATGVKGSQTLVGLAKGVHNVDISKDIIISFNVNDNDKVVSEHFWSAALINDNGNNNGNSNGEILPPNTGVDTVDFVLYNGVLYIENKKENKNYL